MSTTPLRIAYVGNLEAPASTENELRKALGALGHAVKPLQEQRFGWDPDAVPADADLVLWTHTHDYGPPATHGDQRRFLAAMRRRGIATVGAHLDRWWDLDREHRIHESPYFEVDLLCTADGGNDDRWAAAGVRHEWFPPAVSEFECVLAEPHPLYRAEVGFVGSWHHYHPEHPRLALIDAMRRRFGVRFRCFPDRGQPAIRGDDLRRLVASVDVWVGDSCLVPRPDGTPARTYYSDRVPEVVGRGGFLLHPHVDGVFPEHYVAGQHLDTFPLGDFTALAERVEWWLAHPDQRALVAEQGRAHVLERHTYTVRMRELLARVVELGLVRTEVAA